MADVTYGCAFGAPFFPRSRGRGSAADGRWRGTGRVGERKRGRKIARGMEMFG